MNLTTTNNMKNKTISTLILAAGILVGSTSAYAGSGCCSMTAYKSKTSSKDIVATAKSAGSFSTLVAAVKAAGLVETLQGEGPFTVFAPSDEAFAKIPAETLQNLLKPENRAQLVEILTYHVVSGEVLAKDVKAGAVATVNGANANISLTANGAFINEARIVQTDVLAENGVIHVIDTVIMPPKGLTSVR
jgi:uncharacterized surface protein with fasciclin (FAS1) repeats